MRSYWRRRWVLSRSATPQPPRRLARETPVPRTYSQLDLDERRILFRLVEARRPVGAIAERLGRHRSTIYRELGRDRFRDGDRGFRGYFPLTAQDLADRRRRRGRKLADDDGLRAHVVERLEAGWSPQQIAGRPKQEQGRPSVCHETIIHRHVYGPDGRRDGLYHHLPKARRRRGTRFGRKPRTGPIPRERWIENRPAEVGTREAFGHWEGDLVIFSKGHGKANVTSLIERKSRFTLLLPNGDRRSTAVLAGVAGALRPLPEAARRTVRHLRPRRRVRRLRRPRPPPGPREPLLRPAQPLAERERRERERPRPALPAAPLRARGARARPPPPARRPAQRHAAPLPRLPHAARGLRGAPRRPGRAALTSTPPVALRVETARRSSPTEGDRPMAGGPCRWRPAPPRSSRRVHCTRGSLVVLWYRSRAARGTRLVRLGARHGLPQISLPALT